MIPQGRPVRIRKSPYPFVKKGARGRLIGIKNYDDPGRFNDPTGYWETWIVRLDDGQVLRFRLRQCELLDK